MLEYIPDYCIETIAIYLSKSNKDIESNIYSKNIEIIHNLMRISSRNSNFNYIGILRNYYNDLTNNPQGHKLFESYHSKRVPIIRQYLDFFNKYF